MRFAQNLYAELNRQYSQNLDMPHHDFVGLNIIWYTYISYISTYSGSHLLAYGSHFIVQKVHIPYHMVRINVGSITTVVNIC